MEKTLLFLSADWLVKVQILTTTAKYSPLSIQRSKTSQKSKEKPCGCRQENVETNELCQVVLITYIAPRRALQLPCILNAYNLTPLAFCSLFKKPKTPPQHRGAIIRRQRKTGLSTSFKSFAKMLYIFVVVQNTKQKQVYRKLRLLLKRGS